MSNQQTPPQQPSPFEFQKWLHEIKRQDAQRAHDRRADFVEETNRAAIENANLTLRYAVLINGGAAVAVLGFVGGLAAQGRVKLGSQLLDVGSSLTWFAAGVALATLAMGFSYFTNYSLVGHASRLQATWEHPYLNETTSSTWWKRAAICYQVLAIFAGFGSVGVFIRGMLAVKDAITHLG
jgi:hypothetical protein